MTMRATVFDALAADTQLNHFGLTADTMFHNWQLPYRPTEGTVFAILRWGTMPIHWGEVKGLTPLRFWVHSPLELSNDHGLLVDILERSDQVLRGLESVGGVGFVTPVEWSDDQGDEGFQTVMKSSLYNVMSQREAA